MYVRPPYLQGPLNLVPSTCQFHLESLRPSHELTLTIQCLVHNDISSVPVLIPLCDMCVHFLIGGPDPYLKVLMENLASENI